MQAQATHSYVWYARAYTTEASDMVQENRWYQTMFFRCRRIGFHSTHRKLMTQQKFHDWLAIDVNEPYNTSITLWQGPIMVQHMRP